MFPIAMVFKRFGPILLLSVIPVSLGVKTVTVSIEVDKPKPKVAMTRDFAVPVLMYHRICDLTAAEAGSPLTRDLTVSPADFEAQVTYLTENGFSILSVYDVQKALLAEGELPRKAVVITMDDGYRDNFEQAFPILKRHGVSATVFVVTSVVGDSKHLSWPQINELGAAAWSFGSHSVSHPDLTSLNELLLKAELGDSKRKLEEHTGTPITTIAYPSGRFDAKVVSETQQAGYLTGWNKGGGPVRPGDDPYRLPRVRVHGRTTLADFKRKVWSGIWTMKLSSPRLAYSPDAFAKSPILLTQQYLLASSRLRERGS
ncbi:MAG: polysaccharide deacetylase family protein [Fimbriimonadaceae bacterium]